MKITRILCLLLTLAMLFGCASCFSSCNKNGEIVAKGKTEVNLEEYTLIYPNQTKGSITATFRNKMSEFATALGEATGVSMVAYTEANAATKTKGKEILVGLTTRAASKEAYDSIKGDGFAIVVEENTVAIVGTTNLLTLYAMQYFTENYLNVQGSDGILSLPKKVKANELPMVEVASSEEAYAALVYDAELDDEAGTAMNHPYTSEDYDYPYQQLLNSLDKLRKVTGLAKNDFVRRTDAEAAEGNEILYGILDREEVGLCLDTMTPKEYGVFTKNGKIVVTSWNDSALGLAVNMFSDLIDEATQKNEDETVRIAFPVGLALKGVHSAKWVTDFPKPEGLTLYNTQDSGDDSLQYVYMGEGVNAEAFRTYCAELKSAGYKLLTENEIEDSLFATYMNSKEGVALYVSYNAFKHGKGEYDYEPLLRVISAPTSSVTVADELYTPNPSYKKITDSTITAMELPNGAVGMCDIVMLEDGRFVIFDGGTVFDDEVETLWNVLSALHEKAHGTAPSKDKGNQLHIAAWVITHSHGDHYGVAQDFLNSYGKSGLMKMDYLLGNFPAKTTVFNAAGTSMLMSDSFQSWTNRVPAGCKAVKIHTGERYYLANLEIEVLCTQEDLNPRRINYFNDTSCTMRFTMTATDENGNAVSNEAATTTSLWTGDAYINDSRYMTAMFGPYLDSDMVSVAHHGNIGCESSFYDCVQAETIWFTHNYDAFKNYTAGKVTDRWQFVVDYHLVHEIEASTYVFIPDTLNPTVVLTANGVDFDNVFDALSGESIAYGSRHAVKLK